LVSPPIGRRKWVCQWKMENNGSDGNWSVKSSRDLKTVVP
jgi:hypothetical protein